MEETLDYAERRTRARIAELEDGERTAADVLEAAGERPGAHGCAPRCAATRWSSTSPAPARQHEGNLNCPLAVTLSACYFALRVLTDPDVPACEGAYRPLTVSAPEGSLLNAALPGRRGRGQRGDLLAGGRSRARPRSAAPLGQGTMNNLTLGNDAFTYYETLGGGQGACPDADGPSAVHVAMSNTLNTPLEALELEFPLRAVEYSVRRGSGGGGRHRGGDGVVREVEALEEMRYSLITERRRHAPPGADGGEPGARGRNLLNGEELPAKASGTLRPRRPAANRDPRRWRTWIRMIRHPCRSPLSESASWAWGSWAARWRPTSPGRGSRWWRGTAPASAPRSWRASTTT